MRTFELIVEISRRKWYNGFSIGVTTVYWWTNLRSFYFFYRHRTTLYEWTVNSEYTYTNLLSKMIPHTIISSWWKWLSFLLVLANIVLWLNGNVAFLVSSFHFGWKKKCKKMRTPNPFTSNQTKIGCQVGKIGWVYACRHFHSFLFNKHPNSIFEWLEPKNDFLLKYIVSNGDGKMVNAELKVSCYWAGGLKCMCYKTHI